MDNTRTDKNTLHTYIKLYDTLFAGKRNNAQNILEVGIGNGGSIKLWYDYFQNAQIYGLDSMDINDVWSMIKYNSRISLLTSINAYNKDFVRNDLLYTNIKFDVIIDDGPHTLESMKQFIQLYSQIMTDDGILIIENIQSWDWIKQLIQVVPLELRPYIYTYDLREENNRYDNILFTIRKSENRNKTIILTSTVHVDSNCAYQVDKQQRIDTYLKATKLWLQKTNLNIILVENSGYEFPELKEELELYSFRFEIFSFIPNNPPHLNFLNHSKGGKELFSINYAFDHSIRARHSLFIVKITGRFFIPEFEKYLTYHNLRNFTALSQNNTRRCEVVGSHILFFNNIFNMDKLTSEFSDPDPHAENVFHYRFGLLQNVLHCKTFDIEPTPRGGLNETYNQL